jgi:cold shock CspA family protein
MIRMPKWFLVLLCCAFVLGLVGVAMADDVAGKVKAVDAAKGTITITDKDGKDHTCEAADKAILKDIKAGDEVTVTIGADKKATKVTPK